MKVLIISGGQEPSKELLEEEINKSEFVICADSGANCLYKYNVTPDLLLGDFDSINQEVFEFFKKANCKVEKFPKEKDYTDTELAMYRAIELGADQICFLGCTGSRIDHLLCNIGLLLKALNKDVKAELKDDNNSIIITDKPINFLGNKGKQFSLYAYGNAVHNLTIKGAKYPLNNYELKLGEPIGVSNEFAQDEVEINFSEGLLLVMFSLD